MKPVNAVILALLLAAVCLAPLARALADTTQSPQQQLQQVMQDPMFHRWQLRQKRAEGHTPAMIQSLLDQAAEWRQKIARWIGSWFPKSSHHWFGGGPSVSSIDTFLSLLKWTAYVVGGLLLLALIVVLIRAIRAGRNTKQTAVVSRQRIREALEKGEALATESTQWIQEAHRLAQENDLRLAYRAMYLALLSGLHRQRTINFHPHRTNWTYVQHFKGDRQNRSAFSKLTSLFDDVWYGLRPPTAEKLASVQQQVDHLLESGETA